jgi:hypothetical protein
MAATPSLPLLRVAAAHVANGANTDYDGIANYAFNPESRGTSVFGSLGSRVWQWLNRPLRAQKCALEAVSLKNRTCLRQRGFYASGSRCEEILSHARARGATAIAVIARSALPGSRNIGSLSRVAGSTVNGFRRSPTRPGEVQRIMAEVPINHWRPSCSEWTL